MKHRKILNLATRIEDYFNREVILTELTQPRFNREKNINEEYKDLLDPLCGEMYPLNRVGTFLRVTKNFLPHWINFPKLKKRFREQDGSLVKKLFEEYKNNEKVIDNLIHNVGYDLGTRSYTDEWLNGKTIEHLSVINAAAPAVIMANNLINTVLVSNIIKHFKSFSKDKYTILDVGPGTGCTIAPIVGMLDKLGGEDIIPKDYNKKIRVILLDVSWSILDYTKKMLKNKLEGADSKYFCQNYPHKPIKDVLCITENFVDAGTNKELLKYRNRINAIVSGGAIMHNTNIDPFFKTMHDLMHKDGILNIWDWSCGYSWAAPNLKIGNERGVTYEILKDNEITRTKLKEGETINEKLIENADFETTYTILEGDVQPIRENFLTGWMGNNGLFGYHGKKYEQLRNKLEIDFEEGLRNKGFNFIRWLKDNVAGKVENPPEDSRTPYYLIEGYGPNKFYIESMKKAGFSYGEAYPLKEAHDVMASYFSKFNTAVDKIGKIEGESMLFFVVGKK